MIRSHFSEEFIAEQELRRKAEIEQQRTNPGVVADAIPGSIAQTTGTSQFAANNTKPVNAESQAALYPAVEISTPSFIMPNQEFTEPLVADLPIGSISVNPQISSLFTRRDELITSLAESMKADGFQPYKPIIITCYKNNLIVVDGHTRLEAAKKAGLQTIPTVLIKKHNSIEDIELRSTLEQTQKRNMTGSDELVAVKVLIKHAARLAKERQGKKSTSFQNCNEVGTANQTVARWLNMSASKVAMLKRIAESATDEIFLKIKNEELSVNQAYNFICENERAANKEKDTQQLPNEEDASDSEAPKTSACALSTANASQAIAAAEKKNDNEGLPAETQEPEVTVPTQKKNAAAVSIAPAAKNLKADSIEVPVAFLRYLISENENFEKLSLMVEGHTSILNLIKEVKAEWIEQTPEIGI